jgi:predicted HD superfamily hydrolase involved in NAD metabolism
MEFNWKKMEGKLKKELDEDRFRHTMGVMYTSCAMAMTYGADMEKAGTAGLLHDCAKCIPNGRKLSMCRKAGLKLTEFEEKHPFLLHARLGAWLAKKKYGVNDREILDAITWHTTGKPEMTVLEKIVYIADYIEPNRNKAPNLTEVRRLAFQDLDRCMYAILKDSVAYLGEDPQSMDPATSEAFRYYQELCEREEKEGKNG